MRGRSAHVNDHHFRTKVSTEIRKGEKQTRERETEKEAEKEQTQTVAQPCRIHARHHGDKMRLRYDD